MSDVVFNVPMWDGQAREVALVWSLAKGQKHAEARLWTHPLGAEVRVEAGGEFVRTEAGRDPLALVELAVTWKVQFQQKGWTS
jgi:hypothetical protein